MAGNKQNNVVVVTKRRRTTEMSRRRRRPKSNRDVIDISAAILKSMTRKQYLTVTEIIRVSRVHLYMSKKYFKILYIFGLLDYHLINKKRWLSITEKGRKFIQIYDKLTAPFVSSLV
jgi:predicted transcriptional regulator